MQRDLFDDEHDLFRESVAAFVDRELIPARDRIREERLIDRAIWLDAGSRGFLGICVDEEYGGAGVDDYRYNVVLGEEVVRAGFGFATAFSLHTDVVAPYLLELTTEEQKQRWLPRFCTGEMITAIGMTEPGAGSDLASLRATAHRVGSDWCINGSKTFITNGYAADLVVVAARTDADRSSGISLFGVEHPTPGFTRGRSLHKIGQHESDTAELFFEDVRVPATALIGEVNRGFHHMMERLAQERLTSAYTNIAHAAIALEGTIAYVKDRRAFGRPIGTFQNSRFVLAELSTMVDVTRAFIDRCIEEHLQHRLTGVDAAKAKWWSSDIQNKVLDACVQLHGGYGYMAEYDIARAWCDARVTRIWAGSNEIMKEIVGRSLGLAEERAKPAQPGPAVAAGETVHA